MRLAVNLVLVLIVAGLVYVLYSSISEPIAFKNEYEKRKSAVVGQLTKIRTAQEAYRDITGEFAGSFDTLVQVLTNDSFVVIGVVGDEDDENYDGPILYDTTKFSALDSMVTLGISVDSLKFVPFTTDDTFNIQADTLTYQNTLVNVVEVGTTYKQFMGPYADQRFAKYDEKYNPNGWIKFGNLNKPNLAGNWE